MFFELGFAELIEYNRQQSAKTQDMSTTKSAKEL